ncbi:DMT family transporter [Leucobacter denitrificans]|uniref:Multidrug efflux SMR transporter n=1 Tax=Leucobacter denitrificans TaxID=683042 RepID=A0A7G9S6F6_9MICO|nr:multidrug efflux SMR transporter [Leucobacter denitrificans]QNN63431.1 multidrug efflux SMR transporter [Leucobacter denitrificans]
MTKKVSTGAHWVALFASAGLEAAWALALSASNGFTVPLWTIVFLVCGVLSMVGLGYAMRGIPISVAYAIWTGIGAALTVSIAMILGSEPVSVLKIIFLGGIVACVVGLRFTGEPTSAQEPATDRSIAEV